MSSAEQKYFPKPFIGSLANDDNDDIASEMTTSLMMANIRMPKTQSTLKVYKLQ